MPNDLRAVRRSVASRISKILSDYGLENAESGGKFPELRKEINAETGYWDDRTVTSKPPRLIVHFRKTVESVRAWLPQANTNGNFAFANTAGRPVGGLLVRVLPVVEVDEQRYIPYPDWEWVLWYCFWPKLRHGSSGQLFDGFDPINGTFSYMGEVQPYIAAGLVTLNDQNDEFLHPENRTPLFTYREATEALRDLIKIAPTSPGDLARKDG